MRRCGLGSGSRIICGLGRMRPVVSRLRINGQAEQHDQAIWEKKFHGHTPCRISEILLLFGLPTGFVNTQIVREVPTPCPKRPCTMPLCHSMEKDHPAKREELRLLPKRRKRRLT